jgi:hypothetical protein
VANNVWIFDGCKNSCKNKKLNCKCYTNGQSMNMYVLTRYNIHGPFGDIMLSNDLRLDVGYDFIYATKAILVVNVGCNYFIVTNWSCKLTFFF